MVSVAKPTWTPFARQVGRVLVRELVGKPVLNIKLLSARATVEHGVVGGHSPTVFYFREVSDSVEHGLNLAPTTRCV